MSHNSNDHLSIPDLDFGDEALYKQPKPKKKPNANELPMLLAMCVFSFLVLGTYAMVKFTPGMEFKLGALFSTANDRPSSAYLIGNIKLGTTMDVLRAAHPNAQKAIAPNGSITLGFADAGSTYQIWYGEDGPSLIAYKARHDQIIEGISEDDYINTLAKDYGSPSLSTCTRRTSDGVRDCRFSWWMPGDMRVDLISRQDQSPSPSRLMVTTITTDTRLEGRMIRAQLAVTQPR